MHDLCVANVMAAKAIREACARVHRCLAYARYRPARGPVA